MSSSTPDHPPPAPGGAVFLSYAREDTRLRQAYGGQADAMQFNND